MEDDKKFSNIAKPKDLHDKVEVAVESENQVIYKDDEEEPSGCCCWRFRCFSAARKILRRNTVRLAHRFQKRRSRKSVLEEEVVPEDKNDLSAATLAALCGR